MLTMEEAMRQSYTRFAAGEIVKGTIIEVRPKEVLVDIGYKSEGVIPANEFEDIKTVKVGDQIDVLIEKLEDKEGMVVLSKEKAEFKQNWDKILTICNEGGTIVGKVKAIVKGGLIVNIGVEAFLPASLAFLKGFGSLNSLLGQTIQVKIVKINPSR
ncbi:MAG: S1 RNA-binding domain-containing protein, partial [Verrucomicrobia bacterium]|nr:S1 RNA-binding domain-containing protein [Verrucomicrobiota bacterium]